MREQYTLIYMRHGKTVKSESYNKLVDATTATKTDQNGADQFEIYDSENLGSFIRGDVRKDGYIDWIRVKN